MVKIFQELSAPAPEIQLAQELVSAPDEMSRRKVLEEHADKITPEFIQVLASLVGQSESQGQSPQVLDALRQAYRSALKFSMENKMRSN